MLTKACRGRTPLHWAPQLGHLSVAQLLLGHNADLKATDRECQSPGDSTHDSWVVTQWVVTGSFQGVENRKVSKLHVCV